MRKVTKLGRKNGINAVLDSNKGKGGHQTLFYGQKFTIVQTGEIPKGTLHKMCKDLNIKTNEL